MTDYINCGDALHQLYEFLDGELTDEKRTAIADHLDHCAPCDEAAKFETELRHVIADRCQEEVPEDLMHRIAAALKAARDEA
jgi:mycothiol system anti-sigma-R factor